ncbi:helix-turn-helix transcriptional regulator [Listeria monocytogenes]|nr:helix-turn-helix transcriptional regulator [Listeria monocytogenes]EIN6612504.1 helix-turn-helix transcriptional regulator [Listeria monocytogenes]EJC6459832.1 helix-turn-helix transcriptional regulator [Listeria monocytogenes]EJN6817110.1 helix-turn-helix transcriptional regulator [Listeria monocytogenes]EJO7756960.1 helix-turn-helix transcriptional regulator [Listeria monocytogenes]
MISVGNRIKKARIHKGLTQKQLADKIYISSQVISNAEREYA